MNEKDTFCDRLYIVCVWWILFSDAAIFLSTVIQLCQSLWWMPVLNTFTLLLTITGPLHLLHLITLIGAFSPQIPGRFVHAPVGFLLINCWGEVPDCSCWGVISWWNFFVELSQGIIYTQSLEIKSRRAWECLREEWMKFCFNFVPTEFP